MSKYSLVLFTFFFALGVRSATAIEPVRSIVTNSIVFSDTSCGYFSSNSGEFTVYYPIERAPQEVQSVLQKEGLDAVKIRVHYGFRETSRNQEWLSEGWSQPMTLAKTDEVPNFDTSFMLRTRFQTQVAARGYFFYTDLQFVVHFDLADGRKFSDNGTQVPFGGQYETSLPSMVCTYQPTQLVLTPARVFRRLPQ